MAIRPARRPMPNLSDRRSSTPASVSSRSTMNSLRPGTILVLKPGLLTTVQDLGRMGYQRFGMPVAGAMDGFACRAANRLVGNADMAAVLEITVGGPTLVFERDAVIALTGG